MACHILGRHQNLGASLPRMLANPMPDMLHLILRTVHDHWQSLLRAKKAYYLNRRYLHTLLVKVGQVTLLLLFRAATSHDSSTIRQKAPDESARQLMLYLYANKSTTCTADRKAPLKSIS